MNCLWKGLMACVILPVLSAMTGSIATAQVGFGFPMLWRFPSFSDKPDKERTLEVPHMTERDILVEDFESWEKKYPSGYGIGYATIFQKTVLDTQQGSRVLDVNRPVSQFLVGSAYEKHRLLFELSIPSGANGPEGTDGISMETHGIIGFDFRAPPGTEPCDNFELGVSCEGCGKTVYFRLLPFCGAWDANTPSDTYRVNLHETILNPAGELLVTVNLNSDLHDGSWHTLLIDLKDAVHSVVVDEKLDPIEWCIERATNVYVTGGIFRLDNLVFKYKHTREFFESPDLFEMGPIYARIFEPYRYLFIADYKGADITACDMRGDLKTYDSIAGLMLNPDNFILAQDPNDPNDPVVKYWKDLGADPDLFEGAYFYEIFCADDRDAMSTAGFTLFCVNQGTWLNHSPVILSKPAEPVVMKAGEEFILHTPHIAVEDPDGDEIYTSCNIGTCGRAPDGSFVWKFRSNFPGSYLVEIVFYDVRGGYAVMGFPLEVRPWWIY